MQNQNPNQPKEETGSAASTTTCLQRYSQFVLTLNKSLSEKIFEPLFLHVATHPLCYAVAIAIFSSLLPTLAIFTDSIEIIVDAVVSGVPADAYPRVQQDWLAEYFPIDSANVALIHSFGDNVLTKEAIGLAFDIVETIPDLEGYDVVCGETNSCPISSVTGFWNNRSQFNSELSGLSTVGAELSYIQERVSQGMDTTGQPVSSSVIMGRTTRNGDGLIVRAESLAVVFNVPTRFDDSHHPLAESFTSELLELEELAASSVLEVDVFNKRTQTVELTEPITQDLPLVGASIIAMAIFAATFMARWKRNMNGQRFVTSHFLLGIGATFTVVLSISTGYGFCALCGFPITNVTQVLPFILLGIGLDDAFVLIGAYYKSSIALTFEERMQATAKLAGPTIMVTTLTDCVAFGLTAISNIPAVRWFGFYAVTCVLLDFVYQVTFFVALMAIDHRRIKQQRYDIVCCIRAERQEDSTKPSKAAVTRRTSSMGIRELPRAVGSAKPYSAIILNPTVKVIVLFLFIAMLVIGSIFASRAEVSFDVGDLLPQNSEINKFRSSQEKYYFEEDDLTSGGLYYHDLDMSDASVRQQMLDFRMEILEIGGDMTLNQRSFIEDFNNFLQLHEEVQTLSFNDQLDSFFNNTQFQQLYSNRIVRNGGGIERLREDLVLAVPLESVRDQTALLTRQREITLKQPLNANLASDGVEKMFFFQSEFPIFEHYRLVPRELAISLVFSIVAVGIVSCLFLPHPAGTVLSMFVVAMVDVELIGVIVMAGYTINSITFVLLIMAIGLVADYCLHIVHAYLHLDGVTREERVAQCLEQVGGSVLLGGMSTFVGILALAFASGEVFFTFFVVFVSMVVLGIAHGLIFLPVLLSLVGPLPEMHQEDQSSYGAASLSHSMSRRSVSRKLKQEQSSGSLHVDSSSMDKIDDTLVTKAGKDESNGSSTSTFLETVDGDVGATHQTPPDLAHEV